MMYVHIMASEGLDRSEEVFNLDDAGRKVAAYLCVGYRDLIAEVIGEDGEVVANYERGIWNYHT